MKKTIAIIALTALALAAHGQTQTFYSIAKFQTNVFLNDAPTVPLHTRVPTGNVLRATASYIRPEQDLILQGNLTLDTNKSLTLVNDSGVGIVSNGVVLGYNGEIILRRFVSGVGWATATINPTNPLPSRIVGGPFIVGDGGKNVYGSLVITNDGTVATLIGGIHGTGSVAKLSGHEIFKAGSLYLGNATGTVGWLSFPRNHTTDPTSFDFHDAGIGGVTRLAVSGCATASVISASYMLKVGGEEVTNLTDIVGRLNGVSVTQTFLDASSGVRTNIYILGLLVSGYTE